MEFAVLLSQNYYEKLSQGNFHKLENWILNLSFHVWLCMYWKWQCFEIFKTLKIVKSGLDTHVLMHAQKLKPSHRQVVFSGVIHRVVWDSTSSRYLDRARLLGLAFYVRGGHWTQVLVCAQVSPPQPLELLFLTVNLLLPH